MEGRGSSLALHPFPYSALGIFVCKHDRHYVQYKKGSLGSVCCSHRKLVSDCKYRFFFLCCAVDSYSLRGRLLPLFSYIYETAAGYTLGSILMIRAVSRSNKLYDAMEARCYDGQIRVLSENRPPRKKIIAEIVLFDAALLLFAIWRKFFV